MVYTVAVPAIVNIISVSPYATTPTPYTATPAQPVSRRPEIESASPGLEGFVALLPKPSLL